MFLVNSVKEVISLVKDKHGDVCDSDNYQGITVSCVISKLFEHCLMNKYGHYIYSRDVERLIFLIALLTVLIF